MLSTLAKSLTLSSVAQAIYMYDCSHGQALTHAAYRPADHHCKWQMQLAHASHSIPGGQQGLHSQGCLQGLSGLQTAALKARSSQSLPSSASNARSDSLQSSVHNGCLSGSTPVKQVVSACKRVYCSTYGQTLVISMKCICSRQCVTHAWVLACHCIDKAPQACSLGKNGHEKPGKASKPQLVAVICVKCLMHAVQEAADLEEPVAAQSIDDV